MTAELTTRKGSERSALLLALMALVTAFETLFLFGLLFFLDNENVAAFVPAGLLALGALVLSYYLSKRILSLTKGQEKKLSARVAMLEAVINHASEGIIVLSKEKIIRSANSAAQAMFQYTEKELIGCSIETIMPTALTSDSHSEKNLQTKGVDSLVRERLGQKKNGKTFPVELSLAALRHEEQSLITLIISDITERKHMERRLLQAEKMNSIGYLAAGVAHEINTPIQYIGNNISFIRSEFEKMDLALACYKNLYEAARANSISVELLDKVAQESKDLEIEYLRREIPKAISESIEGIDRVADIVRSLKEFAHPGQDDKAPVDINDLIESTVTVSRNTWKYVADLAMELDRSIPLIPAYAGDLKQVVLNLIINAAQSIEEKVGKGMDCKGQILITTKRSTDQVEVSVFDSGLGIPTECHNRIFQPFYTTKEVGKGTGQGLAISKRIVAEKHKGTIDFQSKPGESTTFRILLPLTEE